MIRDNACNRTLCIFIKGKISNRVALYKLPECWIWKRSLSSMGNEKIIFHCEDKKPFIQGDFFAASANDGGVRIKHHFFHRDKSRD